MRDEELIASARANVAVAIQLQVKMRKLCMEMARLLGSSRGLVEERLRLNDLLGKIRSEIGRNLEGWPGSPK